MVLLIFAFAIAEVAFFAWAFTGNNAFLVLSAVACFAACVALVVPIFV